MVAKRVGTRQYILKERAMKRFISRYKKALIEKEPVISLQSRLTLRTEPSTISHMAIDIRASTSPTDDGASLPKSSRMHGLPPSHVPGT